MILLPLILRVRVLCLNYLLKFSVIGNWILIFSSIISLNFYLSTNNLAILAIIFFWYMQLLMSKWPLVSLSAKIFCKSWRRWTKNVILMIFWATGLWLSNNCRCCFWLHLCSLTVEEHLIYCYILHHFYLTSVLDFCLQ